ncbi:hypothetical protein Tco_0128650 [Tanacetum coccineum]
MHSEPGDGVAPIKRLRHDIHGDGVRILATASRRGRLKEDLESSTWRRRYRADMVQLRAALPSTYHLLLPLEIPSPPLPLPSPDYRDAIPEADMLPRKRTCFTAPSHRFEIRESLIAAAARQTRLAVA